MIHRTSPPRIVHTDSLPWSPSPSPSVWRKRLEHRGEPEAGRVTSIVRYDAGSRFPSHPHPEGEEILVLDGVFADEHGEYPAGTFLLNPEGFEHAPRSPSGCTLFVKLRQSPGARRAVQLNTATARWQPGPFPGTERLPLYEQAGFPERIHLTRLAPGVALDSIFFPGGEELFVLDGSFDDEHGNYRSGSWVQYPPGSSHRPRTETGCTLYVKQAHLIDDQHVARS